MFRHRVFSQTIVFPKNNTPPLYTHIHSHVASTIKTYLTPRRIRTTTNEKSIRKITVFTRIDFNSDCWGRWQATGHRAVERFQCITTLGECTPAQKGKIIFSSSLKRKNSNFHRRKPPRLGHVSTCTIFQIAFCVPTDYKIYFIWIKTTRNRTRALHAKIHNGIQIRLFSILNSLIFILTYRTICNDAI